MSERLIEKIDRLGAEAGIKEITPEIRRFALLVRQDTVAWHNKLEAVGAINDTIHAIEDSRNFTTPPKRT